MKTRSKIISLSTRSIAAVASVVIAISLFASLGVNRSLETRLNRSYELTVLSNDLNRGSAASLEPTYAMNDETTVTQNLLGESLATLHGLRDMLKDVVNITKESNDVSYAIALNTDTLDNKMDLMTTIMQGMGDATGVSNSLTEESNRLLAEMNGLNKAITAEMAALDSKLSNSMSYRIMFTFVLPVMP
jgi:hypothetical protein